ncbi:MAG: glycogen/starch synthase [Bacteroidales bacterium]|nr:glycogen/starch synthase [Bacteroidales bacterium]
MRKAKVLYVTHEIFPYLPESRMANICRYLPQGTQEMGREIRTFMPRFGMINERRNQLHEVIRLSGMNLIIDDNDHPLIIKVASIQQARMQIYFIDNEDYFQRKAIFTDKNGNHFPDNDERAIFFSRGVIETVKKLGWPPDVVHCHGWMSSLIPIYIKKAFRDNPLFTRSKVISSLYNDDFPGVLRPDFGKKVKTDGITNKDLSYYKEPTYLNLMKAAVDYSDAVIYASDNINSEITTYVEVSGKPALPLQPEDSYIKAYNEFYDQVMGEFDLDD